MRWFVDPLVHVFGNVFYYVVEAAAFVGGDTSSRQEIRAVRYSWHYYRELRSLERAHNLREAYQAANLAYSHLLNADRRITHRQLGYLVVARLHNLARRLGIPGGACDEVKAVLDVFKAIRAELDESSAYDIAIARLEALIPAGDVSEDSTSTFLEGRVPCMRFVAVFLACLLFCLGCVSMHRDSRAELLLSVAVTDSAGAPLADTSVFFVDHGLDQNRRGTHHYIASTEEDGRLVNHRYVYHWGLVHGWREPSVPGPKYPGDFSIVLEKVGYESVEVGFNYFELKPNNAHARPVIVSVVLLKPRGSVAKVR